jgi:hypothetical protein
MEHTLSQAQGHAGKLSKASERVWDSIREGRRVPPEEAETCKESQKKYMFRKMRCVILRIISLRRNARARATAGKEREALRDWAFSAGRGIADGGRNLQRSESKPPNVVVLV